MLFIFVSSGVFWLLLLTQANEAVWFPCWGQGLGCEGRRWRLGFCLPYLVGLVPASLLHRQVHDFGSIRACPWGCPFSCAWRRVTGV